MVNDISYDNDIEYWKSNDVP
eukprot:COSAG04_NODE_31278_length_257_cov_1.240506_1_plen_20_part_10